VAVAPTYDIAPTTPHVYRAALERMAGLRKNSGLSVAAWHALKACRKSDDEGRNTLTKDSLARTDAFGQFFLEEYKIHPS
jgi:hypothetical protein